MKKLLASLTILAALLAAAAFMGAGWKWTPTAKGIVRVPLYKLVSHGATAGHTDQVAGWSWMGPTSVNQSDLI